MSRRDHRLETEIILSSQNSTFTQKHSRVHFFPKQPPLEKIQRLLIPVSNKRILYIIPESYNLLSKSIK